MGRVSVDPTLEALRDRMRMRTAAPLQTTPQRSDLLFLIGVTVLSWLFWDSLFLWPFRLLVVTFHELGHALAALLTGGSVAGLQVSFNEGGLTLTRGGIHFLILNGGYLGSAAFGLGLLMATRKEGRGKILSALLGLVLLGTALLWVPIFSFGFLYVSVAGFAFLWVSRRLSGYVADRAVRAIGLFSVLYALFDIRSDVFGGSGVSDAVMLAQLTGVPALLWGGLWLIVCLVTLWQSRRWWL
jgi:hypothetical protein